MSTIINIRTVRVLVNGALQSKTDYIEDVEENDAAVVAAYIKTGEEPAEVEPEPDPEPQPDPEPEK